MATDAQAMALTPYVPRLSAEWDLDAPNALWREIDATACFVDISGFTALSERLARRGRIGAEELTEVLNHLFSEMLRAAYGKGGTLLKFGGDALLLLFTDDHHATLATQAAVAMRSVLRQARALPTSVGRVSLRMSVGLHTGNFDVFRVGSSHRELLVTGPAATTTTRMEQVAEAGEIVVSEATAALLPTGAVGAHKGEGRLLRWRRVVEKGPGPKAARAVPAATIEALIPRVLRARLAHHGAESEHRMASLAFVKFQGVDRLLATKGPDETAAALNTVVSAIQQAADQESVTFLASDIDTDGGKIILTTGVPGAQEDDEGRVLRAARTIVEEPLPLSVRIGVNRGHVFAGDIGTEFRRTFTVMGDAVNLAARLMAAAAPGEVFATATVLDYARTTFQSDAIPPFAVKGKTEPIQAYLVGAAAGPKSTVYGTLPFRGRAKELALLTQAFEQAQEGHGGVAVVEAEVGAGKTRLVTELVSLLPPTAQLVSLPGEAYGTAVPYLPLRAAMRSILNINAADRREAGGELLASVRALSGELVPFAPLLAPVVDAQVAPTAESQAIAEEFVRDRVIDVVVAALAAACPGPQLIIAEDAHWFDETTAGICARLATVAATRPWLMCVTRRPETGGFDPPDPDTRIRLAPLFDDDARELVDAATESAPLRPHEREGIVGRAAGNPLFIEELLRIVRDTEMEALPDSLDAVAMREIDALPPIPRRVLRHASVLGRTFDRSLLAQFLTQEHIDVGDDPCAGLHAQLLSDDDERVRFRHAMLQEAAYHSLPYRTRVTLHLHVAETIERGAPAVDDVAPLLALHFLSAQDWERTWRYARLAARVAHDAHAPGEVAAQLERAATASRHLDALQEHDLVTVLADLGWALELLGEYERSDNAYKRAVLASKIDPIPGARLADRRAWIRSEYQGRTDSALRQVRTGIARLAQFPPGDPEADRVRAQLLAREADVRMRQGRFHKAIDCGNRAAGEAERAGEKRALALALFAVDQSLLQMGRPDEATHLGRVLELYRELDDHVRVAITLNNLAGVAFYKSRWREAADFVAQAAEQSATAGDEASAAVARMNLGEIRTNQGSLDEAETLLTEARRTLESFEYGLMSATATMHLGRARAFGGDPEDGASLVRSAIDTFQELGSVVETVEAFARLAEILVSSGELFESETALARARDLERTARETPFAVLLDRVELTHAVASGDRSGALARLEGSLKLARESQAAYEELVMLTLAERLGVPGGDDDRVRLRRELGIVSLPMLPDPSAAQLRPI